MRSHTKETPSSWRKFILTTAAIVVSALPVFLGLMTVQRLQAQTPAAQSPATQSLEAMEAAGIKMTFDVASVKPNRSSDRPYFNVPLASGDAYPPNGGLFSATNIQLIAYMTFAYKLTPDQLMHLLPQLPSWVMTEKFDIQARAEGNPTKDQMRLMMQSLLADRFKLAIHNETKQGPVYALVQAKSGKSGPQLQAHSDESPCSSAPQPAPGAALAATPAAPSATSGLQLPPLVCGSLGWMQASAPGRVRFGGRNVTIGLIAVYVMSPATGVDRPVLDRTGLSGTFDVSLEWSPQFDGPPPPDFQSDPTGPTFTEALQEQLGLKLEPQTGPVDVLVIDHVERPSEN